jgi:hypothetical protein
MRHKVEAQEKEKKMEAPLVVGRRIGDSRWYCAAAGRKISRSPHKECQKKMDLPPL